MLETRKLLLFAVPVLFGSSIVTSEELEPLRVPDLEPFAVTATRLETSINKLSAAVTVVDQDEIQKASVQLSLNESLQTVPGVFALNPYNYAQDSRIAIRGSGARADFGIRGVYVVVDGIPSTLPDGQAEVDGIDLGSAQRIEVIRGPASAIYGPASGGVLRIETEDGPEQPFLETRFTGGDYGLLKTQLKGGGQYGPLNLLISGSRLDYDGYRDNSRTENTSINAKLGYAFENGAELTAVLNAIDFPVQDDPGGLTAAEVAEDPRQARDRNLQFDGGESVRQEKLGLSYKHPFAELHELSFHGFAVQRDFANKLPFENAGEKSFERLFVGGGASYNYDGDPFRLVAGLEIGQQNDARQEHDNLNGARGALALDQDEMVLNTGAFFAAEWSLLADVTLSAAVRHDEVRFEVDDAFLSDGDDSGTITFTETSPMAGISWELWDGISLYGNVATSFETPTTTEFDNPNGGGFNRALEAETATSFEIGLKGQVFDNRWKPSFDLAVFTIEVDDALVRFEPNGASGEDFFRNAGSVRKDGFEAAFGLRLLEQLSARISYTYSDFNYDSFETSDGDFSGNQLPGIPEHFGNLRFDYQHASGFSATWNTSFIGALLADDANSTEVDAYSVSDLRVAMERDVGDWTIEGFVGLNNLFDESYAANIRINAFGGRYFEPAPERNLYAGFRVRYSFGGG